MSFVPRLGFLISIYDELDQVLKNMEVIRKGDCRVIVIQSDPKNVQNTFDPVRADHYELLPDLAGSKENYSEERAHMKRGTTIPARALSRNYGHGFTAATNFNVEWWVAIVGDIRISSLTGIQDIIQKMEGMGKSIAVTRAVGQNFLDDNAEFTRIQWQHTTDIMPQFFIVKANLIKMGLFNQIKVTNRYATEQCLGDEILRFCSENNMRYWDICYSICDYAYPKYIDGLQYNAVQARLPRYIDAIVNAFRRFYLRTTKRVFPI